MRTGAGRGAAIAAVSLTVTLAALYGQPAGAQAPDPRRAEQYGLDLLGLPQAWATSTGEGTVIAIVDTGVDLAHPDLAGRLLPGRDVIDGDDLPQDGNGHGTHVAGIAAAATYNGVGVAGSAPGAQILPVRVLDDVGAGSDEVIAEGITWAVANGADVVNLSLGEEGFGARLSRGGALNGAIRAAAEQGVVVVAASGNEGRAGRAYRIQVPVTVVGAVGADGRPAEFSNFGDPRAVVAAGVGVLSTAPLAPSTLWAEGTDGYGSLDGTSMAAPYVSGVAALLLAQGRTAEEVTAALADTAVNATGDPRLGAGLVDAAAAVALPAPAPAPAAATPGSAGPAASSSAVEAPSTSSAPSPAAAPATGPDDPSQGPLLARREAGAGRSALPLVVIGIGVLATVVIGVYLLGRADGRDRAT